MFTLQVISLSDPQFWWLLIIGLIANGFLLSVLDRRFGSNHRFFLTDSVLWAE